MTADLQRVHAEYANYRKRVERDRELVRETRPSPRRWPSCCPCWTTSAGPASTVSSTVRSARSARRSRRPWPGWAWSGSARSATRSTRPVHEALTHEHRDDVAEPVCVAVYQPGYTFGGRVVRPARVGVAEPDQE